MPTRKARIGKFSAGKVEAFIFADETGSKSRGPEDGHLADAL